MIAVLLLFACAHPTPHNGTPPTGQPLVLGEADANGNPTTLAPAVTDPKALYEGCKARVEGEEKDGECKENADCAVAGCSKEVCVTATAAPSINTLCDQQACFAVLNQCGCVAGRCSWSLKN